MSIRITVLGTGYVGLVTAVGLADFGNNITGCDINEKIVEKLNKGIPTIYEHDLEEYLRRNLQADRLRFSTDIDTEIRNADVVFVAVGTPERDDGSADLSQIDTVAERIAANLSGRKIIAIKSTVPVGTNRRIEGLIRRHARHKNFTVVSNPEFLREGRAMQDFFHPDRVVIGCEDESARETLKEIYRPLYLIQTPIVWCNLETAELIKYASNAFLAAKITFINQMANLAEAVGADIHQVAKTMGMDGRISGKFLHPGPGYGGSCFPKDTKAIAHIGRQHGVEMSLIEEVIRANEAQKLKVFGRIKETIGSMLGATIAVLGVAFKAETDDVRESPAIAIVSKLVAEGAAVRVHDPKALVNFREIFGDSVEYMTDVYDTMDGADCLLILTEWNSYRNLDLEKIATIMKMKFIFDTRNVLDPGKVHRCGFTYLATGRKSP